MDPEGAILFNKGSRASPTSLLCGMVLFLPQIQKDWHDLEATCNTQFPSLGKFFRTGAATFCQCRPPFETHPTVTGCKFVPPWREQPMLTLNCLCLPSLPYHWSSAPLQQKLSIDAVGSTAKGMDGRPQLHVTNHPIWARLFCRQNQPVHHRFPISALRKLGFTFLIPSSSYVYSSSCPYKHVQKKNKRRWYGFFLIHQSMISLSLQCPRWSRRTIFTDQWKQELGCQIFHNLQESCSTDSKLFKDSSQSLTSRGGEVGCNWPS